MYITTSDSNEETNRCTALSLSLSLKARVVADRWMSTTLLRLRRKIFRRTFRACGRRRQKGLAYNSIQSTKVVSGIDQIRKGYLIRSGRNGKYSTTYNAPYILVRYIPTNSDLTLRAKSTHHRARCLLPVLYASNRRLIGYSGVVIVRSLLWALNIYRMALQGMVLRFTGQRLFYLRTNVKSLLSIRWTAICK